MAPGRDGYFDLFWQHAVTLRTEIWFLQGTAVETTRLPRLRYATWVVEATADFGRIVFELIERGEMRKTDRDQLEDFFDIYDFDDVFDRGYQIETADTFE